MKRNLILTMSIAMILSCQAIVAQTTEFTYQGNLSASGTAANGNFDFEFALYDGSAGGNPLGAVLTRSGIAVASGIFSVKLDFGSQFPGANRFLEIRVRQTGGGAFTPLAPRQQVGSSPYSVKSLSAETALNSTNATQLGGVAANQYVLTGDPRMTDARTPSAGSTNYIQNSSSVQNSSNFNISGVGRAAFLDASEYGLNGQLFIRAPGQSNFFVGPFSGTTSPSGVNNAFFGGSSGQAITDGSHNSFFGQGSGIFNTSGSENSFFGAGVGQLNVSGRRNSYFGYLAGQQATTVSDNSFFGNQAGTKTVAGPDPSQGSRNSFFGSYVGLENTIGNLNSFFGASAGFNNTTGSLNALFGVETGSFLTVGNSNAMFGSKAGFATSGNQNSFFGTTAGFGNTEGSRNVFVGLNAGAANTIGNNLTIVGTNANVANANVSFATAIGSGAIAQNNNSVVLGRAVDMVTIPGRATIGIPLQNYADLNIINPSTNANFFMAGDGASRGINFGVDSTTTTLFAKLFISQYDGTTYQDRLTINEDGTVGIYALGSAGATTLCRNASSQIATCSSSIRYKSNVSNFTPGIDLIKKLRPVSFDWKDGGMHDMGLVAEEVAELEPLLATKNEKGEVEGVKYDRVSVVLINAVKEQQAQIEELKAANERLLLNLQKQDTLIKGLLDIACKTDSDSGICKTQNEN